MLKYSSVAIHLQNCSGIDKDEMKNMLEMFWIHQLSSVVILFSWLSLVFSISATPFHWLFHLLSISFSLTFSCLLRDSLSLTLSFQRLFHSFTDFFLWRLTQFIACTRCLFLLWKSNWYSDRVREYPHSSQHVYNHGI